MSWRLGMRRCDTVAVPATSLYRTAAMPRRLPYRFPRRRVPKAREAQAVEQLAQRWAEEVTALIDQEQQREQRPSLRLISEGERAGARGRGEP